MINFFINRCSNPFTHPDQQYPWGNQHEKNRMNIWQGKFPKKNTGKDGYIGVAPVKAFKAQNPFGKFFMGSPNLYGAVNN